MSDKISRMRIQAPHRCSQELGEGQFFTRKWTERDVRAYIKTGGWFATSGHDFDSKDTALLAGRLST